MLRFFSTQKHTRPITQATITAVIMAISVVPNGDSRVAVNSVDVFSVGSSVIGSFSVDVVSVGSGSIG